MTDSNLITEYNYDEFVPDKVIKWMNFDNSPAIGEKAPDFPLWNLDGSETSLSQIWSKNLYTVVEFGSFT